MKKELRHLMEECGELTQAANKYIECRSYKNLRHLQEEMEDVKKAMKNAKKHLPFRNLFDE